MGLDRTAINRARGDRKLTMTEMVAIAERWATAGFFVNDPLPSVVNRRRDLISAPDDARHDTTQRLMYEIDCSRPMPSCF